MLGRSDDMIVNIEGAKINPEQIENHFVFNNGVQCVALPMKLPSGYDKIILIVCTSSSNSEEMKQKIITNIFATIKKMPISEKPRDIYFTNILPLTVLGKVARHAIKDKFIHSQASFVKIKNNVLSNYQQEAYSDKTLSILEKIKKCYAIVLEVNINTIDNHTDFTLDLGGTSLDYYNLVNKISNAIGKEIKLTSTKPLTTPLDFALSLVNE
jgi:acyl carrier protein